MAVGINLVGSYPGFTEPKLRSLKKSARKSADIVFTWHEGRTPIAEELLFELGTAAGLGRFVFLGLRDQAVAPIGLYDMTIARSSTVQEAFDHALYMSEKQGFGAWVQMTSKFVGRCSHCKGSYKVGDSIMWARSRGSLHLDCFLQKEKDPGLEPLAFTAEVIEALRVQNSALEHENTTLVARNASLNRMLQRVQATEITGASSKEENIV